MWCLGSEAFWLANDPHLPQIEYVILLVEINIFSDAAHYSLLMNRKDDVGINPL